MTASVVSTTALYLIDSRISQADRERLIAGLPVTGAWALLDAEQDGLTQIQNLVASYTNLNALP